MGVLAAGRIARCSMQKNVISNLHRKMLVSGGGMILLWLAAFPLFALGAQSRGAKASPRPNIVFILSDDQAHNTLGLAGHPYLKTPNLDRLAREGAWFRQASVATPLCAPSRAAFLTGLYGHTSGFRTNTGPLAGAFPSQFPQRGPRCRLPNGLHRQEAHLQHR